MYNRILVPLDGSDLAECSLSHVKQIATGCHSGEVIVFRVVEPLSANESGILGQERGSFGTPGEHTKEVKATFWGHKDYADHVLEKMGNIVSEAEGYVSGIVSNLAKDSIHAQGVVVRGKVAEAILEYIEKYQVDLIIMSTHGRSGISRWAFGSIADRIVQHSPVPVMLITPAGCKLDE